MTNMNEAKARDLLATLAETANTIWNDAAREYDPYIRAAIEDGEDTEDTQDVLTVRVTASMMILLHVNPYAVRFAVCDPHDDYYAAVRPIVDTAIRLARVADNLQPIMWTPGFFGEHGYDPLEEYALRHPENGLGIPTCDQWQAFLNELEAEGAECLDAAHTLPRED